MSLKKLLLLAVAVLAVISCKKDDEEELLPSLEGVVVFHAPDFIEPGQTLTMTPKGAEHPEDEVLGRDAHTVSSEISSVSEFITCI